MNPAAINERASTVLQSTDLAIRDLLNGCDDPFALAVYLWTMRQHDLTLVNGDALAIWGATWAHRILIDRQIGRRQDEEIVSATLAAAALVGTDAFAGELDEIRKAVSAVLVAEIDRSLLPFQRLSYAAAFLLAASIFEVDEPRVPQAAQAVGTAFVDAVPGGRLFGLDFAMRVLRHNHLNGELVALQRAVTDALVNPCTDFEDSVYLLQALWQVHDRDQPNDGIIKQTNEFLDRSPVWLYLMTGLEDVLPAGDGTVAVMVSHLFRAALLDVALRLRSCARSYSEREIDKRYRGRAFVGLAAFGFCLGVLALPWIVLLGWMPPLAGPAKDFWLLGRYGALPAATALEFLAAVLFISILAPFSISMASTLWTSLVLSAVESDHRIAEVLAHRTWLILKWWLVFVGLAVLVGLSTGIIAPAFQHALGGK